MNGLGSPEPEMGMTAPEMTPGTEPASPEEQAMYDRFVSLSLLALYDEKFMAKTISHLQKQPNKPQAVGEVAAGIFQRVYTSSKENGANIPGEVLINAMTEIIEATVELCDKKVGTDMTPADIEDALYKALDIARAFMEKTGDYNDEMKAADAQELEMMSQNGEIDAMTGGSGRVAQPPPAAPAVEV